MAINRPHDDIINGREIRNINKEIQWWVIITTASQWNNNVIFDLKSNGEKLKVEYLNEEQKKSLLTILQELDPEVKSLGNSILNYWYYN